MNIRVKNILILLLSVTITYSCNNSESNNYMSVSGKIDGLRKGKLYLQQFVDSVFISIDSPVEVIEPALYIVVVPLPP